MLPKQGLLAGFLQTGIQLKRILRFVRMGVPVGLDPLDLESTDRVSWSAVTLDSTRQSSQQITHSDESSCDMPTNLYDLLYFLVCYYILLYSIVFNCIHLNAIAKYYYKVLLKNKTTIFI